MGIRIIRGGIGSGKSDMCLDEIERVHSENPSAKCVMIVPDHYSYETEKRFVERFGGTGLNNIEVLTLRRMALGALTASELNHLTPSGRQMLIYKAVTETCAELSQKEGMDMTMISSMKKRGFLDVAASLISEMKRYLIPVQLLEEKAEQAAEGSALKNKLTAMAMLYGKYIEYTAASGMTDSEDDLGILAEHIESGCGYDADTRVWIDRFDKFMPQQLRVIEALLKKGVHMVISICNPITDDASLRELYRQTDKTVDAVMRLAAVYGFEGEIAASHEPLTSIRSKPDLYHLLSMWNEDAQYDGVPENISLFQSRDTYSETERIACRITELVREEGLRYRDIALMCGNEEDYRHIIEAVFGEYDIPCFTDRKIILSDHPIAMQILSVFSVIDEDWSYESVMRYLRAGFIYRVQKRGAYTVYRAIDQGEIDALENFVLKCGIRGAKRWLGEDPWLRESDIVSAAFGDEDGEDAAEYIDSLRREIAQPLAEFARKAKGKKSARDFALALFEYLGDINLYAGLKAEISQFKKKGMVNEAEQFTKIWNLILDVLNQTTAALGGYKMTVSEFAEYMSVGLSKCEIRTIPSGIDQVYVGSAERISRTYVRVMFVLGAKSGTFPTVIKTEGFFSNRDRDIMRDDYGISIAPDTKSKTQEQYFKVYRAMCAVREKLYLSFSIQDEEGGTLSPSHMISDIMRNFPYMPVSDNFVENASDDFVYISSPKATLHRLLVNKSTRHKGAVNPLWDIVSDWYRGKEEWRRAISVLDRADYYSRRGVMLDGDIANMLYEGKIRYSASRLNTFAACPFEYFLRYGLGARARDEWEVTPANMGSYAHRVINDFCLAVEDGAQSREEKLSAWRGLSEERRGEILSQIIEKTCSNMLSSQIRDKERTASIFRRMGKTISEAASLVQKCLSVGSYAQKGMEYKFETDISDNITLYGLIDRIDECETESGERYIRIIDYKTGKTEFDLVNIYNGYDMQMIIYALAAREFIRENGGNAQVAGVYYTGVRSNFRELSPTVTEKNIREKNESEMCLDGMTFAPDDDEGRQEAIRSMENAFFERGVSAITKVKLDKDKNIKGVSSIDEINGLMAYVEETLKDMDSRSRGGDISLNPYTFSGGRSCVCDYCDYRSVCKFDDRLKQPREARGSKSDILETMKTKGAALKGGKKDGKVD